MQPVTIVCGAATFSFFNFPFVIVFPLRLCRERFLRTLENVIGHRAPYHEQPPEAGYMAQQVTPPSPSTSLPPNRAQFPVVVSPLHRSFFTGDTLVIYLCIYRSMILFNLVQLSYSYALSLCVCDYFSLKIFAKFEFPYLEARHVLFFHRKEFRRKGNGVVVEFLNRFYT